METCKNGLLGNLEDGFWSLKQEEKRKNIIWYFVFLSTELLFSIAILFLFGGKIMASFTLEMINSQSPISAVVSYFLPVSITCFLSWLNFFEHFEHFWLFILICYLFFYKYESLILHYNHFLNNSNLCTIIFY